jgi:Rps23 Pro-64 3,4-dihydroxylase Tpa1-like proline 4-hydroxylase
MIYDRADYVTYAHQFNEDFLNGILKEMEWVEQRYQKDFIDSQIKRNSGPEVGEDDYDNYHRISKVYWLTFITKEDMK